MSSRITKILSVFVFIIILSGCSHSIVVPDYSGMLNISKQHTSKIVSTVSRNNSFNQEETVISAKEKQSETQSEVLPETTSNTTKKIETESEPTKASETTSASNATKTAGTTTAITQITKEEYTTKQQEVTTKPESTTKQEIIIKQTTEQATEPKTEQKSEPVTSDDYSFPIHYSDNGITIDITKQWYVGAWCYVAHIQMSDYCRMRTGMAGGKYGVSESPMSYRDRLCPLLMINGDYSEGLGKPVLRNGTICGNENTEVQAVYSQFSGMLTSGKGSSLRTLSNNGFTDSFDFGANDLVVNGKSVYLRKDGGKSAQRTLIGTTGTPGDIYLVVTEGRYSDGESRGLQYWEAGDLLESLGCEYGVALDGGGSSVMIWKNRILNHAENRKVTDFIYITY